MPTDIAELGIKIEVSDIKDAVKELERLEGQSGDTEGATKKLTDSIKGATASAVKWGAIAGGAAAAGTIAFYKTQIDLYDQLGKLSTRLGASTEALSEYRHVAELSGVSFETLTMGWQRMTRRVAEAAQGMGEAQGALQELGLSAQSLSQLAPEQQFEVLAERLSRVRSESDRVRLAMKLFDSEGVSLIQTMKGGAEGLREMREEARALGLTVSGETARAAEEFNDNLTKMEAAATGAGRAILEEMMPSLTNIGKAMAETTRESGVLKGIWIGLGGAMAEAFGLEGSAAWEAEQQAARTTEKLNEQQEAIKGLEAQIPVLIAQYEGFREKGTVPAETLEYLNGLIETQKQKLAELRGEIALVGDEGGGDEVDDTPSAADLFDAELSALMEGFEQESEFLEQREARRREHVDMLKAINKEENDDLETSMKERESRFASALAAGAQHNKALFEAQKLYRISKIAMETPATIADSYAWGASWGGPPAGALMAGIAGAAMLSYASSVASASFGGGGGGGSAGAAGGVGFTPSAPSEPLAGAQPEAQAGPAISVIVQGSLIGMSEQDFADKIVDTITEAQSTGGL